MRSKFAGLSLVELMVAVGIVGVLATIAVPRYKSFMTQARRGEAKSNLSHLASLQEMYRVEHSKYYDGSAMTGVNGVGYKDGSGNIGRCIDPAGSADDGIGNHLGFRPADCRKLRYFYNFRAGDIAVASAASDADGKYIYPDCDGRGCIECNYEKGDALNLAMGDGKPVVCRNITKFCPRGGLAGGCKCSGTCPVGQVPAPYPQCCACSSGTCQVSETITWLSLTNTPKYTCQSEIQSGTASRTWTSSCPGATACPSSPTDKATTRVITGTDPPDCSTTAGEGIAACPCTPGDTRTCCQSCTIAGTSDSGCTLNDPTVNLANMWECDSYPCTGSRTYTYTPDPPCSQAIDPYDGIKYGEKQVTCDNICNPWSSHSWGNWGACIAGSLKKYQQTRSKTRKCNNPCASMPIYCAPKHEDRDCLCNDGNTVAANKATCDTTDANDTVNTWTYEVSIDQADNTKLKCDCTIVSGPDPTPTPDCTAKEKMNEIACMRNDYSNQKYVWHGYDPTATNDCYCACRDNEDECKKPHVKVYTSDPPRLTIRPSATLRPFPDCTCDYPNTQSKWIFFCYTGQNNWAGVNEWKYWRKDLQQIY